MAGFLGGGAGPVDVRVVPHPAVTLALECGNGPRVVDVTTGRQRRGDLVAGFLHRALRVRGERIACLQLRLSPLLVWAVLGVSPAALDGEVVSLDELWGREAARLRQRFADAASWRARFALAAELVDRRAAPDPLPDPEVAWVWRRITATGGRVRVADLADEVGWSRRRLWSRFRAQVGLPPKRAARLVRFDRAAHRLAAGEAAVQVAVDGGYADQSHLHREVLAFTGMTPSGVVGQPWLAVDGVAWARYATAPGAARACRGRC